MALFGQEKVNTKLGFPISSIRKIRHQSWILLIQIVNGVIRFNFLTPKENDSDIP